MADEDRSSDSGGPAGAGGDARAGWRVLEEQRARIEALREALSAAGTDDDSASFDFGSFFAGQHAGDTPTS